MLIFLTDAASRGLLMWSRGKWDITRTTNRNSIDPLVIDPVVVHSLGVHPVVVHRRTLVYWNAVGLPIGRGGISGRRKYPLWRKRGKRPWIVAIRLVGRIGRIVSIAGRRMIQWSRIRHQRLRLVLPPWHCDPRKWSILILQHRIHLWFPRPRLLHEDARFRSRGRWRGGHGSKCMQSLSKIIEFPSKEDFCALDFPQVESTYVHRGKVFRVHYRPNGGDPPFRSFDDASNDFDFDGTEGELVGCLNPFLEFGEDGAGRCAGDGFAPVTDGAIPTLLRIELFVADFQTLEMIPTKVRTWGNGVMVVLPFFAYVTFDHLARGTRSTNTVWPGFRILGLVFSSGNIRNVEYFLIPILDVE